jgi:hypothetical protein
MKITWDNIDDFIIYNGLFKRKNVKYYLMICEVCKNEYFARKYGYDRGRERCCCFLCSTKSKRLKDSVSNKLKGSISNLWKGGYYNRNIPTYDTFAYQLEPYGVECRRNNDDCNILEVKCHLSNCDSWFIPTILEARNKIRSINTGFCSRNIYCSDDCKKICPSFNKQIYQEGFKRYTSRESQPALRKLVLERDNWTCQKCGSTKDLHCHHFEGIEINPVESADIDNCITLCKKCHKEVHKQDGCNMQREKCK